MMTNPTSSQHRLLASLKFVATLALVMSAIAACASGAFNPTRDDMRLTPTADLETYINEDYGFKFSYPRSWQLEERDQFITLQHEAAQLRIDFTWTDESEQSDTFGRTGVPAGDFIYRGKADFMGRTVPLQTIVYQQKDKGIFVNGTNVIEVGELVFMIALESKAFPYEEIDISEADQRQALSVVESFEQINRDH